MDQDTITLIVAAIGFIGAFFARWAQTNPELPITVRLARVLDVTQIVDSTRRLDDPAPGAGNDRSDTQ